MPQFIHRTCFPRQQSVIDVYATIFWGKHATRKQTLRSISGRSSSLNDWAVGPKISSFASFSVSAIVAISIAPVGRLSMSSCKSQCFVLFICQLLVVRFVWLCPRQTGQEGGRSWPGAPAIILHTTGLILKETGLILHISQAKLKCTVHYHVLDYSALYTTMCQTTVHCTLPCTRLQCTVNYHVLDYSALYTNMCQTTVHCKLPCARLQCTLHYQVLDYSALYTTICFIKVHCTLPQRLYFTAKMCQTTVHCELYHTVETLYGKVTTPPLVLLASQQLEIVQQSSEEKIFYCFHFKKNFIAFYPVF